VHQFEIHNGSQVVGPVGNCRHVKEAHQGRQSTAASRRIGEKVVSPSCTEPEKETTRGLSQAAARIVRETTEDNESGDIFSQQQRQPALAQIAILRFMPLLPPLAFLIILQFLHYARSPDRRSLLTDDRFPFFMAAYSSARSLDPGPENMVT
jgi:hypothetical protein